MDNIIYRVIYVPAINDLPKEFFLFKSANEFTVRAVTSIVNQ